MRKLLAVIACMAIAALGFGLAVGPGIAADDDVCAGLSSGKIDVSGNHKTVTITAPSGQLITGYCVKAGSAKQGDGPVYVTVDPPVASMTISHPTGKDISHYSFTFTGSTTTSTTTTTGTTTTGTTGTTTTGTTTTGTTTTGTTTTGTTTGTTTTGTTGTTTTGTTGTTTTGTTGTTTTGGVAGTTASLPSTTTAAPTSTPTPERPAETPTPTPDNPPTNGATSTQTRSSGAPLCPEHMSRYPGDNKCYPNEGTTDSEGNWVPGEQG